MGRSRADGIPPCLGGIPLLRNEAAREQARRRDYRPAIQPALSVLYGFHSSRLPLSLGKRPTPLQRRAVASIGSSSRVHLSPAPFLSGVNVGLLLRLAVFVVAVSPPVRRSASSAQGSVATTQNCTYLAVVASSTAQVGGDRIQRRSFLFGCAVPAAAVNPGNAGWHLCKRGRATFCTHRR